MGYSTKPSHLNQAVPSLPGMCCLWGDSWGLQQWQSCSQKG